MSENTGRERPGLTSWREFVLGALHTAGVLGAFLAFGLGWSLVVAPAPKASQPGGAHPAYVLPVSDDAATPPALLWLIDGYNVVCANLLGGRDRSGWWRAEHRVELVERLERFDDPAAELWIVFDGGAPEPAWADRPPSRVHTVFAASADAWLIEQVKANAATRPVAVVTGDRKVADRARHCGAAVVAPRALLEKCTG
ncbi:MAG: NYN domain-containing protein [Deltaproteobacteria bacterium]|nr:NYN domain-containing protein [Deltaproteobacteria bacterium]